MKFVLAVGFSQVLKKLIRFKSCLARLIHLSEKLLKQKIELSCLDLSLFQHFLIFIWHYSSQRSSSQIASFQVFNHKRAQFIYQWIESETLIEFQPFKTLNKGFSRVQWHLVFARQHSKSKCYQGFWFLLAS